MHILTHATFCTTDHRLQPVDQFDGEELQPCASEIVEAGPITAWLTAGVAGGPTVVAVDACPARMPVAEFERFCRAGLALVARAKTSSVLGPPTPRSSTEDDQFGSDAGAVMLAPLCIALAAGAAVLGALALVGGGGLGALLVMALCPILLLAAICVAGTELRPARRSTRPIRAPQAEPQEEARDDEGRGVHTPNPLAADQQEQAAVLDRLQKPVEDLADAGNASIMLALILAAIPAALALLWATTVYGPAILALGGTR